MLEFRRIVFGTLLTAAAWPLPAQDLQTRWTPLPPITSNAAPAVSAHPHPSDGNLYVAAVSFSGLVAVSREGAPASWTSWEILGPPPCSPQPCPDTSFRAHAATAPAFARHGTTLYLFARGTDDDLHVIRKPGTSAWESDWTQVTFGGRIRGRFSVAVTQPQGGSSPEFAVLYAASGSKVEFRQLDAAWNEVSPPWTWFDALEGTLGTDGQNQLVAVVRGYTNQIRIDTKIRPFDGGWQPLDTFFLQGSAALAFDLSNVEYLAGAYHVAYSHSYLCDDVSGTYCHVLAHAAIPMNGAAALVWNVHPYTPSGGSHPAPALEVYRGKLVLAFADVDGQVRYARWDTADPAVPWIRDDILHSGSTTTRRPALGLLNRRPYLAGNDYENPNFDDDLFATITDGGSQVRLLNLSRTALQLELDRQTTLWDSNERPDPPVCHADSGDATRILDPFTDGRPVLTEIGFDLWMMPDWLSSHFARDAAEQGCLAGNTSGRFDPPCSQTRYPLILRPNGLAIGVCSGVWLNTGNSYFNAWEEFGHTIAGSTLGFNDSNGVPPDASHSARSGIALADLIAGYNLFGESLGTSCPLGSDPAWPNAPRCRGFTGHANNYDAGTRQHSFIYAVGYYVRDGDLLRDLAHRDIAAGTDLLQRKYDWVRTHIFRGIEFRDENVPLDLWNVDCVPEVALTCGSTYSFNTTGRPSDVASYSCNGFSYTGPEVGHVFRAPVDVTVNVTLSGLSADLDLLLVDPPFATGCSSGDCTLGSTNGGSSSESLSFEAVAGRPYYLMVDGYLGAASAYTLTVTCSGPTPGSVPLLSNPLQVSDQGDGTLQLDWGGSCSPYARDYAVYEGALGSWYSHAPVACSTGGATSLVVTPGAGGRYFLVVPQSGLDEGGYGLDSAGFERPAGAPACLPTSAPAYCP